MNEKQKIPYEKMIFVCVNDRQGEKPSCGDQKGEEIFRKMRDCAKERGLHPRIRVSQAKCLGQCAQGCTIMIYPDNIWIKGAQIADVDQLCAEYLSPNSK